MRSPSVNIVDELDSIRKTSQSEKVNTIQKMTAENTTLREVRILILLFNIIFFVRKIVFFHLLFWMACIHRQFSTKRWWSFPLVILY